MLKTSSASDSGLPASNVIALPPRPATMTFNVSREAFMKALVAVSTAEQFVGMADANIDRALDEMMAASPDSVAVMIRENGEVLGYLRDATAFLSAMDLRLQAAAFRIVERETR